MSLESTPGLQVLGPAEITARLPWPRLIAAIAAGLAVPITAPPRHYHYPENSHDLLLLMPAWTQGRWLGAKASAMLPNSPGRSAGGYLLFDRKLGTLAAVLDGVALTNRRTAAASALAAMALARADATRLLVLGSGPLAEALAEAHASVRAYTSIAVWARTPAGAQAMAARLAAKGLPARAVADAQAAAGEADVIASATASPAPVLRGAWLRPGCHVDLVGAHEPAAREADSDLVAMAALYADVRANVLREAGDIIIPLTEGRITADALRGELTDLIGKSPADLRSAEAITLFKSTGFAALDMIAATAALGLELKG